MMKTSDFDLIERTALFGEAVIGFCRSLAHSAVNEPLVHQLVRAGTSIGANYCEANDAESRKDFRHKISICRKEASETKYWLRMVAKAAPGQKSLARQLWSEAHELHLIFVTVIRTTDRNLRTAAASAASASDISH